MQNNLHDKFVWINEDLVNEIIKNDAEAKADKCSNFALSHLCVDGENFVSFLVKLEVFFPLNVNNAEVQRKSYIIKIINRESRFGKFVDLDEVFDKEITMYEKILPEISRIWKSVGEEIDFGPKCFLVLKDVKAIVLENLSENMYKTRKKQLGLDQQELNCVIEKISKFHAASMLYLKEFPTQHDLFYHGILSSRYNNEWRQKMYETLYKEGFLKKLSSLPDLEEETEKLMKLDSNVLVRASNLLKYKEGGLNVLNHGDLWINNILFKSEPEDSLDMKMIDFQFSCISHPVQDLLYFMMHTLNESDRVDLFEFVLADYYASLKRNLKALGYEGNLPNKNQFLEEISEKIFLAAFYLVFHLMVLLLDDDVKLDMNLALETSDKGDAYRSEVLYGNTKYINAVTKFLKFLNHKQWL